MMTRRTSFLRYLPYLAILPVGTVAVTASAQDQPPPPLCSDLNLPNPIYGTGGSAITPTLAKVAAALSALEDPITILYADPSACTGFQAFLDNKVTSTFKYWEAGATSPSTCNPPTVEGQTVDFAHMGNPASDCTGIEVDPTLIGDFLGPVQTLNIITKLESAEVSISREALYFIYGWGAESQAEPWVDETAIYKRTTSSFVHNFLAQGIGLPNTSFLGQEVTTNQASVDGIIASVIDGADPDATLGYVSGSTANTPENRLQIKTLAYQHTGQECGYWPSLTPDTFDNLNVRNGLYHFWTPGHFFARLNENGEVADPRVDELIRWFQSTLDAPGGIDATKLIIDAGDIPGCAMHATREGLGAVSSYAPDAPCGCYYDYVATGVTTCDACESDDQCNGAEKCRFGYCEAY